MAAEAILFDFGGTLDSNGIPWLDRFYPLYLKHGIRVTHETFARAFHASDDRLPEYFPRKGMNLEQTVSLQVQYVFNALRSEAPNRDKMSLIAQDFIQESRDYFRQMTRFLESLAGRYPLGIVSNFYGNLDAVLEEEGLSKFFKVVADSEVVGHKKPAPEIFQYALKQLSASPEKTWMVGDSVTRDMKGAEWLRMPHAWLKGNAPTQACCAQVQILSSLDEFSPTLHGDHALKEARS